MVPAVYETSLNQHHHPHYYSLCGQWACKTNSFTFVSTQDLTTVSVRRYYKPNAQGILISFMLSVKFSFSLLWLQVYWPKTKRIYGWSAGIYFWSSGKMAYLKGRFTQKWICCHLLNLMSLLYECLSSVEHKREYLERSFGSQWDQKLFGFQHSSKYFLLHFAEESMS